MQLSLSPAEKAKAEEYRQRINTSFFTVVATEIAQYDQLRGAGPAASKELHRIATEYVESHYNGCLLHVQPRYVISAFDSSVAAVLATLYLHGRIAHYPIAGAQVRLRSGMDTGSIAPPRMPVIPNVLDQWANRACQALYYARMGGVIVTEEVVRRVCGRLRDYFGFVWPEKRKLTFDGKESTVPMYVLEHRNLPPVMPAAEGFPRATITMALHDVGPDGPIQQQLIFDADRHGNVFFGTAPLCHVVLKAEGVAPHHTRVLLDSGGNWLVEDAGSETGTFHNGQQVVYGMPLSPNDQIRIGGATVVVQHMVALNSSPELSSVS